MQIGPQIGGYQVFLKKVKIFFGSLFSVLTFVAPTKTKTIMTTALQIRKANPQGFMTMISGTNDIKFDNGVVFTSATPREKTNLWNKLKRMGYTQHYGSYFQTDEFAGLCQAGELGLNPFAYSIICSNPSLNEVCK